MAYTEHTPGIYKNPDRVYTVANGITTLHLVGSIALIAALASDLAEPSSSAVIAHAALSALDKADGWYARREGPTSLGKRLDPLVDKIHTMGLYGTIALDGGMSPTLYGLMMTREAVITGYREHEKKRHDRDIPARRSGKIKTGAQFIDIGIRLSPVATRYPELANAWTVGTTVLALYSGYDIINNDKTRKRKEAERTNWDTVVTLYDARKPLSESHRRM